MNKGFVNYWLGIVLLISIISFFFYKSIFSDLPLNDTLNSIEEIQSLQVKLHRDLLRYRSDQIRQYDTLNTTLLALGESVSQLNDHSAAIDKLDRNTVTQLEKLISDEKQLVEDFKTHHSIVQNSLLYIFNVSKELYSTKPKTQSKKQLRTTAELLTILLEYNENPTQNTANKIYPLIDALNNRPDANTNALINHALMIIERLPEIDEVLAHFNSLDLENQIILLKQTVRKLKIEDDNNSLIFNVLLFMCTIYLIFYIIYIFINLKKSKEEITSSNTRLNNEIARRTKTEKALFQLVDIDKNINNNSEDRILYLLNALCTALDVEYAYISRVNPSRLTAEIVGFLDHGMYSSKILYQLKDTSCEEVLKNGRLVYNTDYSNYFPDHEGDILKNADSYIGISLTNKNEKVIGMIAIASDNAIADTNLAENILCVASSRAIIELERQLENDNTRRYQQGLALIDDWIARLITEGYDKTVFFYNICLAAQEITDTQLAAFPVLDEDQETYQFISASGIDSDKLDNLRLDVDDGGLCAWTIRNNKTLLLNDLVNDSRAKIQLSKDFKITSALLTPVTLKDKAYGAIAVFKNHNDFDKIDEQLITQFSQSVQMAIINMQLVSEMKSERERAEVTLHSIADAVITTNVHGHIEYMNQVAETLTAWQLTEAKNKAVQEVFRIEDIDTGELIHDVVKSCLDDGISINKSALILSNKNDNKKHIESSISPILKTSGEVEGLVIVFHDESQRRQLENTIKHQAAHDSLTNLLNRETFDTQLSEYIYEAKYKNKQHVLCYLDLDHFKLINDTAGHNAGDQCLIQVTSIMQTCIRNDDILGRVGGDEFGLILKNCTRKSALKIANSITTAVSNIAFHWEYCDYKLGVSIGINPLDENTVDTADAIRKADLACYTAKDKGKGCAYLYQEQDSELIRRQEESYWATHINKTIKNNRIRLFAQPIVSLKNKNPVRNHIEILVRLLDEDNQLSMPNAFIPAAERYNLMHLIDRKVILETFIFMEKFSEHDENDTLFSINLSGNTINDETIIDNIKEMMHRYDINPKQLCFEITEASAIKNLKQAKKIITELQMIGVNFSLDDFGSGLSSFQYLKGLPVNFLKIDGNFVADMINNNIDHAMVAAINEVAHIMGIETIAEHVENDQIIKKLQDINVDYGQGYGIEQPWPLEEMLCSNKDKELPTLTLVHNKP